MRLTGCLGGRTMASRRLCISAGHGEEEGKEEGEGEGDEEGEGEGEMKRGRGRGGGRGGGRGLLVFEVPQVLEPTVHHRSAGPSVGGRNKESLRHTDENRMPTLQLPSGTPTTVGYPSTAVGCGVHNTCPEGGKESGPLRAARSCEGKMEARGRGSLGATIHFPLPTHPTAPPSRPPIPMQSEGRSKGKAKSARNAPERSAALCPYKTARDHRRP